MGTLSGERKKAQPIRDRRAAGCRVELPYRRPSSRPALDAGARLSSSYLFFLGAGGRRRVGNVTIEGVRGASTPAEEKIKCALIWRWPQ